MLRTVRFSKVSKVTILFLKMYVVEFIIFGVVTLFLHWCFSIYMNNKKLQKIPGPTPIPFIGVKLPRTIFEIKTFFDDMFKTYGNTFKFYLGHQLAVATRDADLIQAILQHPVEIKKSHLYDLAKAWLKDGLLVTSGEKWAEKRKRTDPAFHLSILKEFVYTFSKEADELIQTFDKVAQEGKVINAIDYLSEYSLDVLAETVFGVSLDIQKGKNKSYIDAINKMVEFIHIRHFSIWKRSDLLFRLFAKEYNEQEEAIKVLEKTALEVIEKKRASMNTNMNADGKSNTKKRSILIEVLLQHQELSNLDILEDVQNFLFAGYDTTSTTLSCALFELSRHADIQEQLYNEIVYHLQDNVANLNYDLINKMTYLDQVIKESMRLRTSVTGIERELTNDVNYAGTVYPKGTVMIILLYWLLNNSAYFPEPEKFDPDRFSPENVAKRHPFAYVPFSAGPRNCIGQKFAHLEVKTALVRILYEFKILPVKDYKLEIGVAGLIKFKNGFQIRLEKRK